MAGTGFPRGSPQADFGRAGHCAESHLAGAASSTHRGSPVARRATGRRTAVPPAARARWRAGRRRCRPLRRCCRASGRSPAPSPGPASPAAPWPRFRTPNARPRSITTRAPSSGRVQQPSGHRLHAGSLGFMRDAVYDSFWSEQAFWSLRSALSLRLPLGSSLASAVPPQSLERQRRATQLGCQLFGGEFVRVAFAGRPLRDLPRPRFKVAKLPVRVRFSRPMRRWGTDLMRRRPARPVRPACPMLHV